MHQHREYIPLLEECEAFISFSPLSNEPNPAMLGFRSPSITVPPLKDVNPFILAKEYRERFKGKRVCMLVPGRAFDAAGTRHGRGGGWYDRFLSVVPREWLRIGVCHKGAFSNGTLVRKPHDEPVDVIAIVSPGDIKFLEVSKKSRTPPQADGV